MVIHYKTMVLDKQKQKELLSELNFIEKRLSYWNKKVESSKDLNLGIFYGLGFGLLGNLLITLLWDLILKNVSNTLKSVIALITLILVLIVIIICNLEHKKLKQANEEIDSKLKEIELDRDKIERGSEDITHWYLYKKYIPN